MSSFAILRLTKLKTLAAISGSLGHALRTNPPHNADPERTALNRVLVGSQHALADFKTRLAQLSLKKPLRKNAVLAVEFFLGASPEVANGWSEEQLSAWAADNVAWLKKSYGAENVISAVLHRDEATPHISAYIVPVIGGQFDASRLLGGREETPNAPRMTGGREERLDVSQLIGGRKDLVALQSNYAAAMKPHGLERGISGSRAKHQVVRRFYAGLNQIVANVDAKLEELNKSLPVPPPISPLRLLPRRGLMQSAASRDGEFEILRAEREKQVAEYVGQVRGRLERVVVARTKRAVEISEILGHAVKTATEQAEQLRRANAALAKERDEALREIRALKTALNKGDLSKSEISVLRRLDVGEVALRLGYSGDGVPMNRPIEAGPKENAIDLVKRVRAVDFQSAVFWLHRTFGVAAASDAVSESLRAADRIAAENAAAENAAALKAANEAIDKMERDAADTETMMENRPGARLPQPGPREKTWHERRREAKRGEDKVQIADIFAGYIHLRLTKEDYGYLLSSKNVGLKIFGDKLVATKGGTDQEIRCMVKFAREKGWSAAVLTGNEAFQRRALLAFWEAGIKVEETPVVQRIINEMEREAAKLEAAKREAAELAQAQARREAALGPVSASRPPEPPEAEQPGLRPF